MKLVTCEVNSDPDAGRFLAGLASDQILVDLSAAHEDRSGTDAAKRLPADMLGFLEAGEPALDRARTVLEHAARRLDGTPLERALSARGKRIAYRREELTHLPAVPRPGKIIHTAINFSSHKDEVATKFKVIMLGKSFDSSCPLGPWLTTRDEISDPQNLKMQLRLNGELCQDANTSQMIYKIPELVSWWSQITLDPG